ncbi:SDR family NAD(P)-dependent oxidoreductase [Novipirellula artificiosorum]|uniref:Putative oxidoreductase n=1 Tax=Novipirellula artificiosorum TaxID=2528016 RepID=A0A5C6E0P9_9BACT|nr:SDR family oxidoreductase [Novipirellula artificiosorum]TWU42295.1 putative oxidoreductase [Novipirellula artificiosorum]
MTQEANEGPVVMVTGGSSGLGKVIARTFLDAGFRVVIVGRNQERLDAAKREWGKLEQVKTAVADVSTHAGAANAVAVTNEHFGRLDALVNCVGSSDRGLVENLTHQRLDELIQQNVHTALLCSVAALPLLEVSSGAIVNIGSLAGKVGARYLGGYCVAKHALSGLTQQMRLELKPRGVHVALVSPGPIRRDDAGSRYTAQVDETLPADAAKPGGGTSVKGIAPEKVAAAVLDAVRRRRPDVVMPGYLRLLIAIGHLSPRIGDWLLRKLTSSKERKP